MGTVPGVATGWLTFVWLVSVFLTAFLVLIPQSQSQSQSQLQLQSLQTVQVSNTQNHATTMIKKIMKILGTMRFLLNEPLPGYTSTSAYELDQLL